ncbi:MAG: RluA family pseudouridine synthase [Rickettsiales bacterium]|nr:RluA family pseudouridine synthase [Rickettsiales bacterium]
MKIPPAPEQTFDLIVPPESDGERIDKWLPRAVSGVSRTRLQRLIRYGSVSGADGAAIPDTSLKVRAGESYRLVVPEIEPPSPPQSEDIPLDVLYEDDDLIIVNKPAGMVVHQGAGVDSGTLVNALLHHTNGRLSPVGAGLGRQGIVHRLDKDTSGAMVAAKTEAAHRALYKQFERHEVRRRYSALAWGVPNPASGTVDAPIARDRKDHTRMCVAEQGKQAVTHYETVEAFTGAKRKPISLLSLNLETGRTHQIRVHMRHIGNPVLGDTVYGDMPRHLREVEDKEAKAMLAKISRQMLHSRDIEFAHPITGARIRRDAPMPEDMKSLLEFLRERK